jgi:hypothetical protein
MMTNRVRLAAFPIGDDELVISVDAHGNLDIRLHTNTGGVRMASANGLTLHLNDVPKLIDALKAVKRRAAARFFNRPQRTGACTTSPTPGEGKEGKEMLHIDEPSRLGTVPPRLATEAAMVARRIDGEINASNGYHHPTTAARHAEIERRYAWAGREARKHHCSPHRLMAIMRTREITCWFRHRYGDSLPDDDAGREDLALFVNYLVQISRTNPINATVREARAWAPWLTETQARGIAERAIRQPIKLKADTLAAKLGVTDALRVALGFTTIGACDLTRAERDKAKKQRHAAAQRDRRRRNGAVPRAQYLDQAKVLRAEAAALGVTYDALRKRKRRALSQVRADRKCFTAVHALGTPRSASRPHIAPQDGFAASFLRALSPEHAEHQRWRGWQ